VVQRTKGYLNNRMEQDHRGVKQRTYPRRGFGNFEAAARVCRADDAQRNYFRAHIMPKERGSLAEQRQVVRQALDAEEVEHAPSVPALLDRFGTGGYHTGRQRVKPSSGHT
jgi:transposase-like protein